MKQLARAADAARNGDAAAEDLAVGRHAISAELAAPTSPVASGLVQRAADAAQNSNFQPGNLCILPGLAEKGQLPPDQDRGVGRDWNWAMLWCCNRLHGALPHATFDSDAYALLGPGKTMPEIPLATAPKIRVELPAVWHIRTVYSDSGQCVLVPDNVDGDSLAAWYCEQEGGPCKPDEPKEPPEVEAP